MCEEHCIWLYKVTLAGCKKDCDRSEMCIKCALILTIESHPHRYMRRCRPCGIRSQFRRVDGEKLLSENCFCAKFVKKFNKLIPNSTIEM